MWSIYGDPDYESWVASDRPISYFHSHHNAWRVPTLMTTRAISESGAVGEVGRVTVSQDDGAQWHQVGFSQHYDNPVVVMGPLSSNGVNPATLRVKDVTATGFRFQIDEWDYLDEWHTTETMAWMVMEAGRHALPGGVVIEAGLTSTDGSWASVSFSSSFATAPVVFSQISTRNGGQAATTRQRDVSRSGFAVSVQEEEANGTTNTENGPHRVETISWVAISPGLGVADALRLQAAKTANEVTSNDHQIDFSQSFSTAPALFSEMQSFHGWNSATIRYDWLSTSDVTVYIHEEQSSDDEINHVEEVVGWLAIETGVISVDDGGN
jgi:hypothetical protein